MTAVLGTVLGTVLTGALLTVADTASVAAESDAVETASPWTSLSTGSTRTCGSRADLTIWCWGDDDVSPVTLSETPRLPLILRSGIYQSTGWRSVSVGGAFACGIRKDYSLWCWGRNSVGQLGDGTLIDRDEPTQVGTGTWKTVDAGLTHACAIAEDETLWCWGKGGSGQLGHGEPEDSSKPVRVSGLQTARVQPDLPPGATSPAAEFSTWAAVSAGTEHTCGIRHTGSVFCWGANDHGQLGDGTTTPRPEPHAVDVQNLGQGTTSGVVWTSVTTGAGHTCALDHDGDAWCWGRNSDGQLGDDGSRDRLTPVRVRVARDAAGRWEQVSAGGHHTCGVRTDGGLWCWGLDSAGQLGNGAGDGDGDGAAGPQVAGSWEAVSAGTLHTCATAADGSTWCWGENGQGQLGLGDRRDRATPEQVAPGFDWAAPPAEYDVFVCMTQDGPC